jgi:hypothetical protein
LLRLALVYTAGGGRKFGSEKPDQRIVIVDSGARIAGWNRFFVNVAETLRSGARGRIA